MRTRDFYALNDLLFKYVFGREERKNITLSFINAVLGRTGAQAFVDLSFADRTVDPEALTGKSAVLDLLCIMDDETQINIEVQVQNQHDMAQRTLFYWSRLYQSAIKRGENYRDLRRTITINLLGYSILPQKEFHNVYGLYDIVSGHHLTADIEIHFLELPKAAKALTSISPGMRLLEKWMAFFNNNLSDEEMEALAMSEAAINEAWDAMSEFVREAGLRHAQIRREMIEHDYASNMRGAREEGLAQGLAEGRAEGDLKVRNMIIRLLRTGMPAAEVAAAAELSRSAVQKIAEENGITVS